MDSDGKGYKIFLWMTIAGNLAALILEKLSETAMPGISFFVFCMISFYADLCLRRKKNTEVLGFWEFGAYLAFFPKLISGPITRWETYQKNRFLGKESEKQLWRNLEKGITLFIIGLGYKVLLADSLAALWNEMQTIGFESISTLLAWMGMFAYSLEIYFDFQGYSLMAIGVAAMMGITLPTNFLTLYIRILPAMACDAGNLVSGLCVHSPWGKQGRNLENDPQSGSGMGADRTLAWHALEFLVVGRNFVCLHLPGKAGTPEVAGEVDMVGASLCLAGGSSVMDSFCYS